MADDKDIGELRVEFRRELERLGLTPDEAEKVSKQQFGASENEREEICQHVVPVSRGWIVLRDYANQDVGLFPSKEEALLEAHSLADAAGLPVVVHDDKS